MARDGYQRTNQKTKENVSFQINSNTNAKLNKDKKQNQGTNFFFAIRLVMSLCGQQGLLPFGLMMTSALGFKARVEPLFACFLACMQLIPQIHLWCDTCRPLDGQYCSRSRFPHALAILESLKTNRLQTLSWNYTLTRFVYSFTGMGTLWRFISDPDAL